jgi:hypothetical protein
MSSDPSPNPLEYATPAPVKKGRRRADCVFAWTVIGVVVTIPAFLTAVLWGGGGHANDGALKILFPYSAMLSTVRLGYSHFPVVALALFGQYGAYGVICGLAESRGRLARTVIVLIALHAAAAGLCFIVPNGIHG